MDKATLATRILDYADRPDLDAQVDSFIDLAEGLIRRELRAAIYSDTLEEADRVSGAIYSLTATVDTVRVAQVVGEDRPMEQKSLAEVRERQSYMTGSPLAFAVNGDTIEFDVEPGTDVEIKIDYLGHPAPLVADEDTNDILDNHPALYIYGALFHLHQYVNDPEAAQGALDTFSNALLRLNEQTARKLGGAAQKAPYHFGRVYRGY